MNKFSYEFDKEKELGVNHYIHAYKGDSGICTCGHYDYEVEGTVKECPSCKTKSIICVSSSQPGRNMISKIGLFYLKCNNEEFKIICKELKITIELEATLKNNKAMYKIKKGVLNVDISDYQDLHFYYGVNKKGNLTLKSDFFIKGEKHHLLAEDCPNLSCALFVTEATHKELNKINIEQYSALNIWKVYSFYKHGPNLIKNGHINLIGGVGEIRKLNSFYTDKEIGPFFDEMIEQFRYITNSMHSNASYYSFKYIYGKSDYYYGDPVFDADFMKYVVSLDNDILKETYSQTRQMSLILRFLHELGYTAEECNNFLALAIRQKVSLYTLCDYKFIQIAKVFNKYNVSIEKNPKDIRIYLAKVFLLNHFNTYLYADLMYEIPDSSLQIQKLKFENKIEYLSCFLTKHKEDFFTSLVNLAIEKNNNQIDIALLHDKNNRPVEDCLVLFKGLNDIYKILYKDIEYSTPEEIREFLTIIEEDAGLNYAV